MSDNPATKELRDAFSDVWKDLTKRQQEALKLAASAIDTETSLPEAPASVYFTMVDKKTLTWIQFTVRSFSYRELRGRLRENLDWFTEHGYESRAKHQEEPQSRQQSPPQPPPPQTTSKPTTVNSNTFETRMLVGNVHKGKVYWKVQGGKYSMHGITIWPEVYKAGTNKELKDLDVMQKHPLEGYTAYFSLNDKGQPEKVTKLVNQGSASPPVPEPSPSPQVTEEEIPF